MKTKHDWSRLDSMIEEQRRAASLADQDAQPLSDADMNRMSMTPRLKMIRRALALTQEEFAARYQIPLGTLRDWEQGAKQPDQAARAYLRAIAGDPVGMSLRFAPWMKPKPTTTNTSTNRDPFFGPRKEIANDGHRIGAGFEDLRRQLTRDAADGDQRLLRERPQVSQLIDSDNGIRIQF